MLNFVVCDDNINILDKLPKMLESIFIKHGFDASIGFNSDDFDEIINYVDNNKTDVLILDINLKNGKNGLDIAEVVRRKNKNAYLIFTTGHLEYAMMAYKFKTFDYIAKPLTPERLEETIVRLFDDVNGLPKKYIKIDNKNTVVDVSEINYIKRDGMKLIFHTVSRDYEIYSSFNKIESSLPKSFVRCHKSFIVNSQNVTNVDPVENRLYLQKNDFCDIGPKYKNEILEVFKNDRFFK